MSDDVVVDALGLRCPQPVIALAKAIRDVEPGAVVVVRADDPVAAVDIPAWCWTQGHDYLGVEPDPVGSSYRVRRAAT